MIKKKVEKETNLFIITSEIQYFESLSLENKDKIINFTNEELIAFLCIPINKRNNKLRIEIGILKNELKLNKSKIKHILKNKSNLMFFLNLEHLDRNIILNLTNNQIFIFFKHQKDKDLKTILKSLKDKDKDNIIKYMDSLFNKLLFIREKMPDKLKTFLLLDLTKKIDLSKKSDEEFLLFMTTQQS